MSIYIGITYKTDQHGSVIFLINYSSNMAILSLNVTQYSRKRPPSHARTCHHLMLAGISQTTFLQNWGKPDTHVLLKRVGTFHRDKSLYLVVDSDVEADYSVLLYRKKNKILFFSKKRLIIHSKWNRFEEKNNELKGGINANSTKISPPLIAKTLALIA